MLAILLQVLPLQLPLCHASVSNVNMCKYTQVMVLVEHCHEAALPVKTSSQASQRAQDWLCVIIASQRLILTAAAY